MSPATWHLSITNEQGRDLGNPNSEDTKACIEEMRAVPATKPILKSNVQLCIHVIPAEAGIQENLWTPAFAGVTDTGIWCQDFHVPL
jgi:hypothetical protein